jgi:branched-chain amino acid transport system substrate-binding protein
MHFCARKAMPSALSRRRLLGSAIALPWLHHDFAHAQSDTIVLGQSTDLSGPLAELGSAMHQGALAAFAAINARGGIHGRRIALNTLDDAYEVPRALSNVKALMAEPHTFALFNCMGTSMIEAMLPMVLSSGIPFFAPFTGALLSRVPQRSVFNIRASYAEETEKLVQHLATLGTQRIGIVYQANAFGKEVFTAAQRSMARLQLDQSVAVTVENSGSDAQAAANRLDQAAPEAVIIGLAGKPTLAFVRAFRGLRRGTALYALSVMGTTATVQALGADATGMAISQVMPLPTNAVVPVVRDFLQAWKSIDATTQPSHLALEGYINARVFCEVLQRAGRHPTRAAFIDSMWDLKKIDLGGFEIHASAPGQNASRFVELTVVNRSGKFVR